MQFVDLLSSTEFVNFQFFYFQVQVFIPLSQFFFFLTLYNTILFKRNLIEFVAGATFLLYFLFNLTI